MWINQAHALSPHAPPWLSLLHAHVGLPSDPLGFESGQCAAALEVLRSGLTGGLLPDGFRFQPSVETLKALEYEARVAQGAVPTRDVFHDWYNGLVCLGFPRSKRAINQLHLECAQAMRGDGGLASFADSVASKGSSLRGRLRDALTLLDESGALILTTQADVEPLLRAHDWNELLVRRREDWGHSIRMVCVGHGLLDALRNPHKGLCAKVLVEVVDNPDLPIAAIDSLLESRILALHSPRDLSPLPVMGIPGWFDSNRDPGFYQDEGVFRKKPTR